MSVVGIAGTTETGNVDPLEDIADVARSSTPFSMWMQPGAAYPVFPESIGTC